MAGADQSSLFTDQVAAAEHGPPMIGALMRLPWEAVHRRMLQALRENGFGEIDGPRLSVLLWPGPDGMRPSDLAARMKVTKQALNYLLGDLERLGYLQRHPDPEDRRARRIALTDRGRELVPIIRGAVSKTERDWAASLGEARFAQLLELLVELNQIAAREPSEGASG
jgi:DNA-binding MarR family transcriptional regulator